MSNFSNHRERTLFDHFTSGLESKLQTQLSYEFQRHLMLSEYERQQEMKRMKEEIIQEVLARISVTIDVSEVLEEIEAIRKALDSLYDRR